MSKKEYTDPKTGKKYVEPDPEPKEVPEQFPTEFWKAETEGDQVEGILKDKREGQFGEFFVLENEGQEIGLPTNVNLNTKLETLANGTKLRITFLEWAKGKRGRSFKKFRVQYW